MKDSIEKRLSQRNRQRLKRLKKANETKYRKSVADAGPELSLSGLKYELSDKVQGIVYGGIPLMVSLAQKLGLTQAIDRRLNLLKFHLPCLLYTSPSPRD